MSRKYLFIGFILGLTVLGPFALDIYSPSLPTLTRYYHTSISQIQYTLSIYLFGYALGQFIFGTLSDFMDRKSILLIGLFSAIISCFLATKATSIGMLLAMRFWQGLSFSVSPVLSKVIASEHFSQKELVKISSLMAVTWGLSPILAPVIGAHIQYHINWQANFFFLGFLALLILIFTSLQLKKDHRNKNIFSFRFVFEKYKHIIKDNAFQRCVLGISTTKSTLIVFISIAPFLIQHNLHYSAISYGNILIITGTAYVLGAFCNRFLIHHLNNQKIRNIGFTLAILSSSLGLVYSWFFPIKLIVVLIPSFMVIFIAGICFPNFMAEYLDQFKQKSGSAAAAIGTSFIIIAAIISYLIGTANNASFNMMMSSYLALSILGLCSKYFKYIPH